MNIENDKTGEKIIAATFKILQEEGFQKATTKRIAAEAGVNEVTIFRKFKNKQNLVEITKDHYFQLLKDELNEIFEFTGDEEIDEYLKLNFYGILVLSDDDFSIIKVAMEEVRDVSEKNLLISQITDIILNKLEEFFKLQIEKGVIRKVNPKTLSLMTFSILFQSLILSKIYGVSETLEKDYYADEFLDIVYKGIEP